MIIRPIRTLIIEIIFNIEVFFNPEYLKISTSLLLNKFMKKSWVETKKINGNISKINVGEFKSDIYIGKKVSTLKSLKNSSSVRVLRIITKLNITKVTKRILLRNILQINFM